MGHALGRLPDAENISAVIVNPQGTLPNPRGLPTLLSFVFGRPSSKGRCNIKSGGSMKLVRLRLSNFRSFGADYTELDLEDLTFLLGPNGAGKTAVLQALARMFSLDPAQRKVKKPDFHVPYDEKPEHAPAGRALWIEADFEFPELLGKGRDKGAPAVPGNFAHMQLTGVKGPAQVRFRLHATVDQDDDIEENFTFVIKIDNDGQPLEEGRVAPGWPEQY